MKTVVKELLKDFSKEELLELVKELDIRLPSGVATMARDIVLCISKDMQQNGVPGSEDCSDLMFEFLTASGVVDDDDELVDGCEFLTLDAERPTRQEKGVGKEKLPECFGFADERDPACKKCKVFRACYNKRVDSRPTCFGKLYGPNAEECVICLEADDCRKEN